MFSFVGYEYHLDSALVKPTQERWLKLQDLIVRLKLKHVLTTRCLMSLIGFLASMEKMVPEGRLHMRPFQFHLKEHWRYPQSLDSLLPWTDTPRHLDWLQNPANVMKGSDLHPKDHSIQLFTDASNEGWGAHLAQSSTKGLWSDQEKRLQHKRPRVLGLTGPSTVQGPVSEPNSSSCSGQLNSGNLHKQRGTHSAGMCVLLWKIMTWCHHYRITLKARHIPGCLNVMADLLSRSNQVQSTEWSLHPQMFKQICHRWFTPHVDLFATHLNHKLPLYVSPIPDPKAWDIDALNINWTGLTAYAYLATALLHRVIQKIRQCHCLIIVIAPGWPGMPWFWDLVQLSTEIPLQLPVSTTLLKQSHNYVFHSNPQHLNLHAWCLGVDNSKNKASVWRSQRELLTKAPFEPMKDTDLKHLTLKTTFLLALASGKRRSEIHAWVANKVSNLGQWEKVALFPCSYFIAKNQLASEGSQSVSPVTIPALTTIVDRQFKEDRTLCPVRALRYYLDRTKDLRGSRSLLSPSRKDIRQTSDPLRSLLG